jgi:hypothetical protein
MRKEYNSSSEVDISQYDESTIQTALYIYNKIKNKQLDFQKQNPEVCRKRSNKYVQKIKADPVKYRAMLDKNKDRYWRKKAAKAAEKEAEILKSAEQCKSILESKDI